VNNKKATQLEAKTLLNRIQRFAGFVYQCIILRGSGGSQWIEVKIEAHQGMRGKCSKCLKPCPGSVRILRNAADQTTPMCAGQLDQHRDARRIRRSHDVENVAIPRTLQKSFSSPAHMSCANPQTDESITTYRCFEVQRTLKVIVSSSPNRASYFPGCPGWP